jgi:hypothetical protein
MLQKEYGNLGVKAVRSIRQLAEISQNLLIDPELSNLKLQENSKDSSIGFSVKA